MREEKEVKEKRKEVPSQTQETKSHLVSCERTSLKEEEKMEYKVEKKKAPGGEEVEVLGATFEEGKPEGEELGKWRQKLESRDEKLKYLRTGERYWYGEGYGSEKRKQPA